MSSQAVKFHDSMKGRWLKITWKTKNQKFPRAFVGQYLGENYNGEYQFNQRPLCGTTSMPPSLIISWELAEEEKPQLSKIIK